MKFHQPLVTRQQEASRFGNRRQKGLQSTSRCSSICSSAGPLHALDAQSRKGFFSTGQLAILNIIVLGIDPAHPDRFERQGCPRPLSKSSTRVTGSLFWLPKSSRPHARGRGARTSRYCRDRLNLGHLPVLTGFPKPKLASICLGEKLVAGVVMAELNEQPAISHHFFSSRINSGQFQWFVR